MHTETPLAVNSLEHAIEALIFAAEEPLNEKTLLQVLHQKGFELSPELLKQSLVQLQSFYEQRSIRLVLVHSGWRFQIAYDYTPLLMTLWEEKPRKHPKALLEILALIAYRGPITRPEMEAVRGAAVNPAHIKTLLENEWIHIAGYKECPGRPALFETTSTFLDHFNLQSLSDLPPLPPIQEKGNN